jgi:hypothetical protein
LQELDVVFEERRAHWDPPLHPIRRRTSSLALSDLSFGVGLEAAIYPVAPHARYL